MRFKERTHFHNIKVHDEAASPDVAAAASSPEDPTVVIHKGGDTEQQIVSVDEKGLSWKKMPSRAFLARQKAMHGFK